MTLPNLPAPIREAFRAQAEACDGLGSPFTATLCRALPGALAGPLRATVAGWPGDPLADALALRLAAGLHALARDGRAPEVAAAWPPATGALAPALATAFDRYRDFLLPWLASPPQTNEVARSGVLLGLARLVADRTGLPLELLEIGAAAGLNLALDRYAYDLGPAGRTGPAGPVSIACDWRGAAPRPALPEIAARAGCDRAPVDARDPAARERLLAWIWPDQPARRARAEAALALAAEAPWRVEAADAAEWLEDRLARPPRPGTARLLVHSVVWQYLAPATKARLRAALDRAGTAATRRAPLAWASMEGDGRPGGAALRLTLWPGGRTERVGRADWHGRFADWGTA